MRDKRSRLHTPEGSDMRLQKRCCNTNSGQYELIRVWSLLTVKCSVNSTNQWIIECLNTNRVRFLAEDFPSEGRLQITSWDVMTFVWRVSLNIGGIREAFTFAYCARRIVAILILVSTRGTADSNNWHMHLVDMPMGFATRELVMCPL